MSPRDPRWIGAWWLGFLAFGIFGIVTSLPLFFFARRIKPLHKAVVREESERKKTLRKDIKGMLKAVVRLLTNPIYMCMILSTCVSLFATSGMLAFLPKYLEVQYLLPAWKANVLIGAVNVVGAALGTMVGGVITTKLKLSPLTCIKLLIGIVTISMTLHVVGFFLGCPQPEILGDPDFPVERGTSNMTCDVACDCEEESYFPVCGENGVNYYSPCQAGCNETTGKSYTSCSCISGNSTAVPGLCVSECGHLYPYIIVMFFAAFSSTLGIMPGFLTFIRSVPEVDKPLAIGLSAFFNNLLGWLPGPVVFGMIMDTTCMRWTSTCSGSGACLLHSLVLIKDRYHAAWVVSRLLSLILYIGALVAALKKTKPFFVDEYEEKDSFETKALFVGVNSTADDVRSSSI